MLLESKVLLSSNCFHTNPLNSNLYKITFSNARGLGLGHYIISDMLFFISGIHKVTAHYFMESRSHDGVAVKSLYCVMAQPIAKQ